MIRKELFGLPSERISYEIRTRGKLVILLTNGRYVTFTQEELGAQCNILRFSLKPEINGETLKNGDGSEYVPVIDQEPFVSKLNEALGGNEGNPSEIDPSVVKGIIDRGNLINGIRPGLCAKWTSLETLVLPVARTPYGYNANVICCLCDKLKRVYLPQMGIGDVFSQYYYTHHCSMFRGCTSLEEIDLPSFGCVRCAYYLFRDCTNLRKVHLGLGDTMYLDHWHSMFMNCPKLKKLEFENVRYIEGNAVASIYNGFSSDATEILFPKLESYQKKNKNGRMDFSNERYCKKAVFGRMPLAEIKKNKAWNLPVGCHVYGKDGDYII